MTRYIYTVSYFVSTHSRPKAAALRIMRFRKNIRFQHTAARRRLIFPGIENKKLRGFNTQPPEGG